MKWIKGIILVALGFLIALGVFQLRNLFQVQKQTSENSTLVLEKIKKVAKLIAVEGEISEIYDYKDYYAFDIWPLRKKALIRVRAKVSIGYDLESMQIDINEGSKTVTLDSLPSPEILSIEHELDYYDMQEGIFNIFNNQDITKLSKRAKEFIEEKAREGALFEAATEQADEFEAILKMLLEGTGWKLIVKNNFRN